MTAVGVGFVGAGAIADVHREALDDVPGATLVGIVDSDARRAEALAARARPRHGDVRVLPDVAALAAAGARVVHVLTPPHAHAGPAAKALAHGCDVLVEKPLATSDDECETLARAECWSGRRLGVNHSLLTDPHVARVLAALRSGTLGEAVGAEYACSAVYPPWTDGPPPPPYREGGNPFRDLGVHGLYLLRAALGEIEAVEPAFASRGGDPNLCFDEWHVRVRCARGIGVVRLSWNTRPLQTTFTVQATRGVAHADVGAMFTSTRRPMRLPHAADRAAGALQEGWPAVRSVPVNGLGWLRGRLRSYAGVRASVRAFHARIADGGPLPASLEDGRTVVRWVEDVARAADDAKRARSRRYRPAGTAAVLVTGAGGRLGAQVVASLAADGVRVRALCRRPPADPRLDHPRVEIVLGDLGDASAVDAAMARVASVVHAGAAMQGGWPEHARGTVAGTRHVVASALAHGVQRLVHVSSLSVLDWHALHGRLVTEDAPLEPHPERRGAYTRAKLLAERCVLDAVAQHGVPAVVLRPGVLVGAGGPTPDMVGAFVLGERLLLLGRGDEHPPLVPLDAVVEAVRRSLDVPIAPGTLLHLVGEQQEDAATLARAMAPRVRHVPWPMVVTGALAIELVTRALGRDAPLSRYRVRAATAALRFDCTRARTTLGWTADVRPMPGRREGVAS